MSATRYIVAPTDMSPEPKSCSTRKAAETEANARAAADRVDVAVTTNRTGKVVYVAQGARLTSAQMADLLAEEVPAEEVPAEEVPAEEVPAEEAPAEEAPAQRFSSAVTSPLLGEVEVAEDEEDVDFDALLAEIVAPPAEKAPAEDTRVAPCGCRVAVVIDSGHLPSCEHAVSEARRAERAEAARPKTAPKGGQRGGGGRRESQGPSAVDGWELLYDKPKQDAQVGRAGGKYALICTIHKHAHPLDRLTQERGLRGGKRSVWCPDCKG